MTMPDGRLPALRREPVGRREHVVREARVSVQHGAFTAAPPAMVCS